METTNVLFETNSDYEAVKSKYLITRDIYIIGLMTQYLIRDGDNVCIDVYTSFDNPFVFRKSENTLYINEEYYFKNQKEVDEILINIVSKSEATLWEIKNSVLVTKGLIKALANSYNGKYITLGSASDIYTLTYEDYLTFKNSRVKTVNTKAVAKELLNNFDPLIVHNYTPNLISGYSYAEINKDEICINLKITEKDLENLKYLYNSDTKIVLSEGNMMDIFKIASRLNSLKKNNNVVINVKDKDKVRNFLLSNKEYLTANMGVIVNWNVFSVFDFLRFEDILYAMVNSCYCLSPFERFIYIYNEVKNFKKYKDKPDDIDAPRDLYAILENDYMVCAGYANLLGDLLEKSGIVSVERTVKVDLSFDKNPSLTPGWHARRYVYLKDSKYNIDGFYISDPTWDNDLENDYYNHMLLTGIEEDYTGRYNYIAEYNGIFMDLLNVKSIDEFYQKLKYYVNRLDNSNKFWIECKWTEAMIDFIRTLRKLDPEFIYNLEKKYPEVQGIPNKFENLKKIIDEVGHYVASKANKPIPGEILIKGLEEVYRKMYKVDEEKILDVIKNIVFKNKERQYKQFPKRCKFDNLGHEEVLPGIYDKFDIDISGPKR